MTLTFNDGTSNVLVLQEFLVAYDSTRDVMVNGIPYSTSVQGADMIDTLKDFKINGDLFISPHSTYAALSDIKAAFENLHPGSPKTWTLTDSNGVWNFSLILIPHFNLSTSKDKPNGFGFSIDCKKITMKLGP